MATINERIKEIRKKYGLTQAKFGERIGVKQNTVAQYEMGRNIPLDSVISLICKEFSVREEWLRTGSGPMTQSSSTDEEIGKFVAIALKDKPGGFKRRLALALSRLDEDGWAVLEQFANMLVEEEKKEE